MDGYYNTPGGDGSVASVYILDAPHQIDKPYLYYIPQEMREAIHKGSFVIVPFGTGNRKQFGLVVALPENINTDDYKFIKPIASLLYDDFSLDSGLLRLCEYLRESTLCTMGEAARTMIPAAAFGHISEYYYVTGELTDSMTFNTKASIVYNHIKNQKRCTLQRLRIDLPVEPSEALRELCAAGLVDRTLVYREPSGKKFSETIEITDVEKVKALISEGKLDRAPKQKELLSYLLLNCPTTLDKVTVSFEKCRVNLKALEEKGYIKVKKDELYRNPYENIDLPQKDDNVLSDEQKAAFDVLEELSQCGEPKAALLHGVTGSGKTRVIKALCDSVIADGREVIILIPEIALTVQTVAYFKSCYGDKIAVIHSALSDGERLDMWNKIRRGEVDVCIGTRSAVFAPFTNLGLIVIDEEQEHTYKSDIDPKYNARDVASFRCGESKAMMLLASATPSVESYTKAKRGIYTLVKLNSRYGNAVLPQVIIHDMRIEAVNANVSCLGKKLIEELSINLHNGEQSILFLNRRGYNNFVSCLKCGSVIKCPHCSVSLTRHNSKNGDYLSCHYCGYRMPLPSACPDCGCEYLNYQGYGTQRVEQQLGDFFPGAKILRLDADTTTTKNSYNEILGAFRRGEADILLGTQMVTKGHDFPNVTLCAVLNSDASLYLEDYRCNERTFSQLCQLVGRAGRANKTGRALIQTYNPDHPIIKMAAGQDYIGFYENEIKLRRSLVFPPYCDILLFTVTSENELALSKAADILGDYIKRTAEEIYPDIKFEMFGPFEAPIYMVKGKYRRRVVLKINVNKRVRSFIRSLRLDLISSLPKNCTLSIDINPNNL